MTPEHFLGLVVVALCAYRLTRLVTADSLTDPLRAWLWSRAFVETGYDSQTDRPAVVVRSRRWWWVYELVRCPFCLGVYISALTWWAWRWWPWAWVHPAVELGAVVGMQAFVSSRRDA